jgi:HlyD family secretion protein
MSEIVRRRRSKTKAILTVAVVLAAAGGLTFWALGGDQAAGSSLIKGRVERGSIRITVTATGTLEAVRTVQVGSQISGQIAKLHADYNSVVKQGQLLAEIDPRTFESQVLTEQAQLAAANARLQSSQADLINQEANLTQVEASVRVAEVAYENAKLLYERSQQLLKKGLVSENDNDVARTNAESAEARLEQARATVKQAQAQIRSRQAAMEQVKSDIVGANAQLERAEINLELTKIFSPVDGVVISRSVDIGQTVAASLSAPTLFLIANDLSRMQVKASIDEADIGKITPEVQVSFTVDAYPADLFVGQISEVRLEPQTVQNVVTYSTIIAVDNPQQKLKPGMTANLTMVIDEHNDVLTVPNAALRFTPANLTAEEVNALISALPPLQPPQGSPAAPAEGSAPSGDSAVTEGRGARGEPGAFTRGNGGQRGGNRGGGAEGGAGRGNSGGRGGRGGGAGRAPSGILWIEDLPGVFRPMRVRTGLTDGSRTEVMGADLTEGLEIVVSDVGQTSSTTTTRPAGNLPFGVPNIGGGRGRGGF